MANWHMSECNYSGCGVRFCANEHKPWQSNPRASGCEEDGGVENHSLCVDMFSMLFLNWYQHVLCLSSFSDWITRHHFSNDKDKKKKPEVLLCVIILLVWGFSVFGKNMCVNKFSIICNCLSINYHSANALFHIENKRLMCAAKQ